MRISAGSAKGRKLGLKKAFKQKDEGDELRPTSGKVRQAVFDILGSQTEGSVFLDLFAGTGAVGLEALSRGAERAILVERNAGRAALIREASESFGFGQQAKVVRERADAFLSRTPERFDIIFADPPYNPAELSNILKLIDEADLLKKGGSLIAEHSSKFKLGSDFKNMVQLRHYKYGDTSLTLFRKESI